MKARIPLFRGIQGLRQALGGRSRREGAAARPAASPPAGQPVTLNFDIAPDDPLLAYFQSTPSAAELDRLEFESPALTALRAAGVRLTVPLVSQGELVGLLNLGPRLSEQDYSADDRVLLDNLALQAGPAVRVAQLVREQQAEIQARERLEQELRVARLIQQTLLPKELPALAGWALAAIYRPARAVGGDFYDFITLPGHRLGLVIGDVTDKGVPAALVMATTRATLRSAAQQFDRPGEVLAWVNDQLYPEIPPKMFVTCLYAILNPANGRLQFANAGHDLPYRRSPEGKVCELRATGMPLGLMPGMIYEERETVLEPGETVLFYTDGLVEAHNADREMFSFKRTQALMAAHAESASLIDSLLGELASFTGAGWEQEDDVSLVTLERSASTATAAGNVLEGAAAKAADAGAGSAKPADPDGMGGAPAAGALIAQLAGESGDLRALDADGLAAGLQKMLHSATVAMAGLSRESSGAIPGVRATEGAVPFDWPLPAAGAGSWRTLAEFALPSAPGNEREAISRVADAVAALGLQEAQLERLKTAVGEATMNAMEHGNKYRLDAPAEIRVLASDDAACVQVTDHGGSETIPKPETPDIEAKLAGLQSPRGWGLFLIQNLVDEMHVVRDNLHHTVELTVYLRSEGGQHAGPNP